MDDDFSQTEMICGLTEEVVEETLKTGAKT
jgi:hypothetical protein